MKVDLSQRDLETAYTALRLELQRNWGGDPEIVSQIKAALDAIGKILPGA